MTSIYEKKISAEVRLIHAEQMFLYNFIVLRKKQQTQMKTKQLNKDILNQQEAIGFPKLSKNITPSKQHDLNVKDVVQIIIDFV